MLLDWSCQERDYGYAFYGHPVRNDAPVRNLRYISFKILYNTQVNICHLQIRFDDLWHAPRSVEFEFSKLSDAWDFTEAIVKYLKKHPDETPLIGVFS